MQHNAFMSIKNGYGNWLACKSSLLQLLNSSALRGIRYQKIEDRNMLLLREDETFELKYYI